MPNPSPIQCSKCSAENSAESLDCSKCGGRVVRICGSCGFSNSAAKGFCDVCGDEMTAGTAGQIIQKPKVDATPNPENKPEKAPAPPPPTPEPEPEPAPAPEPEPAPEPTPEPAPEPAPAPRIEIPEIGTPPVPEKKPEAEAEKPSTPTPAEPNPRRSLEDFLPRTGVQRILPENKPGAKKEEPPKKEDPLKLKKPKMEPPKTIMRRISEPVKEPPKKEAKPKDDKPKREEPPEKRFAKPPAPKRERPRIARDDLAFTQRTIRRVKERPVASTVTVILLLAISAGIYGVLWKQRNTPSRVLMKAAGNYLFALKEKNFGAAYEALSQDSKTSLSSDQFTELQEKGDWSFDDLEIKSLTEKWGFITYKLYGANTSGDDWLHFINENGKWKRAYWWHHMSKIEDSLASRDFQTALQTANEAAKINPRDPLVNSYLCEAAYGLQRWETTIKVCLRTFQAAKKFRSRLEPKDLFHLHTLMADIYRNHLGKPEEALAEYNIMLAFPLLDADSRCDTLLARADTLLTGKKYSQAMTDYRDGADHCRNTHDKLYAQRNANVLSGEAGEEAVALLKEHKMPGDPNTLYEWRQTVRKNLARELKTAVEDLAVMETWTASHLQGPRYKVTVTDRSTPILTGEVDLLENSFKVNIHVQ